MRSRDSVVVILMVLAAPCLWAADLRPVVENSREILYLDTLADAARWEPSECTVTAAEEHKADGRPSLSLHIPVDHHGGEKKYPVGWPRMYCNLKQGMETNWHLYDRLEFMVHTTSNRDALPDKPLNFQMHCPDKTQATYHMLTEMALDEWVTVSIATADIPNVEQISRLGFNISESDYEHGDELDVTVGGFKLIRSAECQITEMAARAPAIFEDRGVIPLEMVVAGPPENVSRGVPLTLRQGDRTLRIETLPVQRGRQTVPIDVTELRLTTGAFAIIAFDQDPQRRKTATVRVVESPWKDR